MDLSQLKTQVMTMMMVNKSSNNNDIYSIIYTMLMVNIIEYIFRGAPYMWQQFITFMKETFLKKTNDIVKFIPDIKSNEPVYSITLLRNYDKSNSSDANVNIDKVDSVIEYICNINTITQIKLDKRYSINTKDDVHVTPQIRAKMNNIVMDDKGEISIIELIIYSYILNVNQLREWIDEVYRNYCYEKNNKLGNRRFYFDEVPMEPQKQLNMNKKTSQKIAEEYNWSTAPKALTFTMNEFKTSKSFCNVFGSHVAELKERINLFVNHPEWYAQRGIPHSLGILLHGIPGAGKTSTIKAIAKDTNRHIFNLSLRKYTTQKQLINLFFNENVNIVPENNGGKQTTYAIPVNQRIYVIEDIDCLTDVVFDRRLKKSSVQENGDGITLSFILNLLDGILETPGRILIITSNYPDKLDKALIRPGRIDIKINFKNASKELICEMINNFYSIQISADEIPDMLDSCLSPAEILESLCTNFKSYKDAIEHMKRKKFLMPIDLTKSILFSLSPENSTNNLHYMSEDDSVEKVKNIQEKNDGESSDGESSDDESSDDEDTDEGSDAGKALRNNIELLDSFFGNTNKRAIKGTSIVDILSDGYGPLDIMNDNLLG
jgi:AAA+ superfamily predicted ATPase